MANNRYCIDLAKRGTAGCKECNKKIEKGLVRIAKIIPNPFTESGGEMKQWFHVNCIFVKLSRARATTKKIESTDDLEGWDELKDEHKPEVLKCLSEHATSAPPKKTPPKKTGKAKKETTKEEEENDEPSASDGDDEVAEVEDNCFQRFRKICTKLGKHNKYTDKTAILQEFFTKGSDGEGFKGNLYLWAKMLLPAVEKRIYNLQNTQILKIFSKIFEVSLEEMQEDFQSGIGKGDVSETVKVFFEKSDSFEPAKESKLYLQDVDKYLDQLAKTGQEVEQTNILTKVAKRCTASDLKYFIRFIKHDLRINAGPKHILKAVHPSAYEAFQASRNLKDIIKRCKKAGKKGSLEDHLDAKTTLMTPVLPMLAMACKDLEVPFKKYPEGFYVEIKYDGERVQIHKRGKEFSYFSRSLKPVMPHKVNHFKDYIPKAFPYGNDLMLDCEILLVDNEGKPLPFGTLGAHRKAAFKDASVCLFVFDCLQFNNENVMQKPLVERRKILEENMQPIKNHIMFSELKEIDSRKTLNGIVSSVIDQGLEGIVIKAKDGVYEPGKRHWLKLKKDYLKNAKGEGMADSADLVVLGGYYGTGKKGGIMSVFLMGCYNPVSEKWCTVTKVPGGDDQTLAKLQKSLKVTKINKDQSLVPNWLNINKGVIPDFVIEDPKKSPVWEISGAEFSKADIHTASGISIRFPRVSRVRTDKNWETATNLQELKDIYEASKTKSELIGLRTGNSDVDDDNDDNKDNVDKSSGSDASSSGETPKRKTDEFERSVSKKPKKEDTANGSSEKEKTKSEKTNARKKNSEEDSSLSKKKKVDSSKKTENLSKPSGKNDLPNVFSGVKLHIPTSLEKSEELRRYFIAFDGHLLKDHETDEASHVIVSDDTSNGTIPEGANKVTVDWLWDSIKLKKKQSENFYKPQAN
ncbi:DNA ligase 3 [Trichonephila clavata]|uniref:DNA ligase n=1 Tax=Trichonephila clavata TaxID=2740835 RepID=A0A8X6G612_TRICU|nr:DNA ligase 3 [Trichonephila clavata]